MRRAILLSLSLLLSASFVMAQGGPPQGRSAQRQSPEEMAKSRADMFQEEFGLSDEQRDQTEKALLTSAQETREKMMEMRDSGASRDEMTELMTENRESLEKEIKKIFTADQWTAYQKWIEENPPQQRRRRGGGR